MSSRRVLVAADDEAVRLALNARLGTGGIGTVDATTVAADAAEVRRGVDLVLLDLRLPGGDVMALLHDIHAVDPDVVVLVLSAGASVEDEERALAAGAFDCL